MNSIAYKISEKIKVSDQIGTGGSLAAGFTAALGASVCCAGPFVLVTLGIGGAWLANLRALQDYYLLFVAAALAFAAATAVAEPRTVTLDVQGMYCAVCPLTVSRALKKVPGVIEARASYEDKSATVTYDDARTGIEQLVKATAGAGYPSAPRKSR